MSVIDTLARLAGSDFDHVTRSETLLTRRIGGGRQQVWRDGAWHPYQPEPRRKIGLAKLRVTRHT